MAKRKKKNLNSYTLLFILIIVTTISTWIIPAGKYKIIDGKYLPGTYQRIESNPQGIIDIFEAPVKGMLGTETTSGAIDVALFIMVIGGFLAVISKTQALTTAIKVTIQKNQDKYKQLISILMFLFALGGSSFGMAEETMPFYSLLIPIMLTLGLDTITAVGTVLIGSGVGVIASTLNPFSTGIASNMAGISIGDGIGLRLILLIIFYILATLYMLSYAKKIKKDPSKSLVDNSQQRQALKQEEAAEKDELNSKQKQVLVLFAISFILMILGLIPWQEINPNWTFFLSLHEGLKSIPFIGKAIGYSLKPLGTWSLSDVTVLFFMMSVIIALVYRLEQETLIKSFIEGCAGLLDVAFLTAIARGIQVVMNEGNITATILHFGEVNLSGLPKGLFIIFAFLFFILLSFIIPSSSGLAATTMGLMVPLASFAGVEASILVTAFQLAVGIVNLITPTYGVLIGALSIGKINVQTWWHFIWRLILMISIISLIALVIGVYV